MATAPTLFVRKNDYPTRDGRPMAETDLHRELMVTLIKILQARFAPDPQIYVSGNLLVFYERGNKRRHLSPDVFVVRGVPKGLRENYLIWEEGKSLDLVIELTSASTRKEDLEHKMQLYRDVLKVPEYFLFDPRGEYLQPALRGYRLAGAEYVAIDPVAGRLPSEGVALHLEGAGENLRLYDPSSGKYLPTPEETLAEAEQGRQAEARARRAETRARRVAAEARQQAEAEVERLRREIEELRRQAGGGA
jgi:Uma2 family endonuclease